MLWSTPQMPVVSGWKPGAKIQISCGDVRSPVTWTIMDASYGPHELESGTGAGGQIQELSFGMLIP